MSSDNIYETVSILLTGKKNESLVKELTGVFLNPNELVTCPEMLAGIKGLGKTSVNKLKAGLELPEIMNKSHPYPVKITCPKDAAGHLSTLLAYKEEEHFYLIALNVKNYILGIKEISIGTLSESAVHPREAFRFLIRTSSASVIFAHNHPSGDSTPSDIDIATTNRLKEAGKLIGIEVLDHLIITRSSFFSLKENQLL